jgi:hypothetical protein
MVNRYDLYPPTTTLGWRVIRKVTAAEVDDALARSLWREVYNELGNFAGYQIKPNFQTDDDLPTGWSSRPIGVTVTISEMDLNAGTKFKRGKSRTLGQSEDKRIARKSAVGKALPPEDAVERAIEKVKLWPFPANRIDDGTGEPVYGDRAVRCYPKPA